jgi:hypothetical protein
LTGPGSALNGMRVQDNILGQEIDTIDTCRCEVNITNKLFKNGTTRFTTFTRLDSNPTLPEKEWASRTRGYKKLKYFLKDGEVPVWVRFTSKRIKIVDRHKAEYVLVDVRPFVEGDIQGDSWIVSGWDSMRCIKLVLGTLTCSYVNMTHPIKNAPPRVKQAISAAFSQVENFVFGAAHRYDQLYAQFDFTSDTLLALMKNDCVRPKDKEFERAKISSEHHTHLRPEEIWDVASSHKDKLNCLKLMLTWLRRISGLTEAVVSTFMLYATLVDKVDLYLFLGSKRLSGITDVSTLTNKLKEVATPLKSVHNPITCDLTSLFELQVLVNRGIGAVDWVTEKSHRVNPDVVNVSYEQVKKYAKEVFDMGVKGGYVYPTMSWDSYVQARWQWSPSGSVHSQYEDDHNYISKSYRHRTKFVTLCKMGRGQLNKMLSRPSQIRAWPSVKYEWAKQRAIYGTDLTSTVITNFAMYECERVLKDRFPVGVEAEATRVHKKLEILLADCESFCYDFDDFNAQHSKSSMSAVLDSYLETFGYAMSEDQVKAMEWVRASIFDVKIKNKENDDFYEPKGTLLSGWRLTTFMNTVLNYAYMKISGALDTPGVVDSVHNGDDVLVAVDNISSVTKCMYKMSKINARAQATKCNLMSVGEFLRVEHKSLKKTTTGAQYLTRACATAVHGRTESQEPSDALSLLQAHYTRVSELEARCGSDNKPLLDDFRELLRRRVSEVFSVPEKILSDFCRCHKVVGGMNVSPQADIDVVISRRYKQEGKKR